MPAPQRFVPLPEGESLRIAWPTPNHSLFDSPEKFFARTRANPDYGKPGFTRDCGKRFHRGVDIAPVSVTATGQTTRVIFTDCATNRDYESVESTFIPHDEVFCVCDGKVHEIIDDESKSDFGKHIVVEHTWPRSKEKFFTVYAHLSKILIPPSASCLLPSALLGRMGQTCRSADARNWLAIAPHLHFEVRNENGEPHDPLEFLRRFIK